MPEYFYQGATAPRRPELPHYQGFTVTLRHTTLGRTPLDKCSVRGRELYLARHSTLKRETSMSPQYSNPQSQQV